MVVFPMGMEPDAMGMDIPMQGPRHQSQVMDQEPMVLQMDMELSLTDLELEQV